jgi:hypothetical protein
MEIEEEIIGEEKDWECAKCTFRNPSIAVDMCQMCRCPRKVTSQPQEVEEDPRLVLIDAADAFLGSELWKSKVSRFLETHCELFDPECSGNTSSGYSHGHYDIWKKYKRFVESALNFSLQQLGGSVDDLVTVCIRRETVIRQEIEKRFQTALAAYESFPIFSDLMKIYQTQHRALTSSSFRLGDSGRRARPGDRCPLCDVRRDRSLDRCAVCDRRNSDIDVVATVAATTPTGRSLAGRSDRIARAVLSMVGHHRRQSAVEISSQWSTKAGIVELTVHRMITNGNEKNALKLAENFVSILEPLRTTESHKGLAKYLRGSNILCRTLLTLPNMKERARRVARETFDLAKMFLPFVCCEDSDDDDDDVTNTYEEDFEDEVEEKEEEKNITLTLDDAPDELCCPITCELMDDPVKVCDGFIYDRDAIEEWFQMHDTSPMTNLKLENKTLTPDHTTANLVKAFREKCASSSSSSSSSSCEDGTSVMSNSSSSHTNKKETNLNVKTRWSCSKCTLENEMYLTLCEACGNARTPNVTDCRQGRQECIASIVCCLSTIESTTYTKMLTRLADLGRLRGDARSLRMRLRRIVRCYAEDDKRGDVLRDQLDRIGLCRNSSGDDISGGISDWLQAARQSLLLLASASS